MADGGHCTTNRARYQGFSNLLGTGLFAWGQVVRSAIGVSWPYVRTVLVLALIALVVVVILVLLGVIGLFVNDVVVGVFLAVVASAGPEPFDHLDARTAERRGARTPHDGRPWRTAPYPSSSLRNLIGSHSHSDLASLSAISQPLSRSLVSRPSWSGHGLSLLQTSMS